MITASDEGLVNEAILNQGRELAAKAVVLLNGYISYLRKAAITKPTHEGGPPQ
jgi:hypothetical protein